MAVVGARRVEVLSGIPGRTRYRVARVKGRSRLARELEQDVARLPGVVRAQVNPLTGGVLLLWRGETPPTAALAQLVEALLSRPEPSPEERQPQGLFHLHELSGKHTDIEGVPGHQHHHGGQVRPPPPAGRRGRPGGHGGGRHIALASNDLRGVVDMLTLGRQTLRIIQQNYAVSVVVNSGGVAIGALGLLNPVMAAIMHNLSTQIVVLNSLRLLRYQPALLEEPQSGAGAGERRWNRPGGLHTSGRAPRSGRPGGGGRARAAPRAWCRPPPSSLSPPGPRGAPRPDSRSPQAWPWRRRQSQRPERDISCGVAAAPCPRTTGGC